MSKKDSQFKAGNPGGPGRPTLPPEVKELRSLNQLEFNRILNDLSFKTKAELQLKINDPETPVLELAVAAILAKAMQNGDQNRFSYITDRLVGKPKENIEIQMRPYEGLDDDELTLRIAALERRKALPPGASDI